MMDKISHTMLTCSVNKKLKVEYQFQRKTSSKFNTVREYNNTMYITPSFSMIIGEPYGSPNRIFIPSKDYFQFVILLDKSVKLVQQYALELFPNMTSTEFDIDHRALERFSTEKAMYSNGMSIIPTTWSNDVNETFPAIQVTTMNGVCRIPLEDAMVISQMLSTFDPHTFGLLLLNMIGY